jgi:CRISPR type III-B/RAMP module-associated protein Cmr5
MSSPDKSLQSLSQRRAQWAWSYLAQLPANTNEEQFEEIKKFPQRIRNAGMLQTVAFMRAKKKAGDLETLRAVESWLRQCEVIGSNEDLLKVLRDGGVLHVRLVTRETLAFVEWLIRFHEGRK